MIKNVFISFFDEKLRFLLLSTEKDHNSTKQILSNIQDANFILEYGLICDDEEIDEKHCCPHCGAPQEVITLDKPTIIFQGDYKLTASEIRERLEAALLEEKRHHAYESKINQLKIMYPVDIVG